MSEKLLVGKSLSFCVRDIADGKVDPEDVVCIVAGTRVVTEGDWTKLTQLYLKHYWTKNPDKCLEVVNDLRKARVILQPRVQDLPAPRPCPKHWVAWEDLDAEEDLDTWWIKDQLAAQLLGLCTGRVIPDSPMGNIPLQTLKPE